MKTFCYGLVLALAWATAWASADEVDTAAIESLKKELAELRQRAMHLEQRLLELEARQSRQASSTGQVTVAPAFSDTLVHRSPDLAKQGERVTAAAVERSGAPMPNGAFAQATPQPDQVPLSGSAVPIAPARSWSPAQPIPLMRAGVTYMNLSFDALVDVGWSTVADVVKELELGDHDPSQRGFSLRNAEVALDGAVDPYFKGFVNLAFKLDSDNSTGLELEEAYLLTTALPGNFQLKAGQFYSEFGRQNSQHPHQWAFVDQPLVLNRAFGPDGLRNPGACLSWLVPTPFYTEMFLGVFNGQGGTAFGFRNLDAAGTHGRAPLDRGLRGPGDLLYVPRVASSFEVSDTQTLLVGGSAALGPNDSGQDKRTRVYGIDTYWKWKSAQANAGFPFVSWQNEALYHRYEAGAAPLMLLPVETLEDWGFYSQLLWGIRPRWVIGLRGEFVTGNDGAFDFSDVFRGDRTRLSPNLTWYPSEFSKIRLQYNFDHGQRFADAHSVWLQLEFLLGAHGAHKF
jgi:hypothetical protein